MMRTLSDGLKGYRQIAQLLGFSALPGGGSLPGGIHEQAKDCADGMMLKVDSTWAPSKPF